MKDTDCHQRFSREDNQGRVWPTRGKRIKEICACKVTISKLRC